MDDFSYNELEFKHVDEFAIEYKSFFMDNKLEYDVFDFDDACSTYFIVEVAFSCETSTISLDLKPLPDSLKYAFLGLDESVSVIIASNLDQHQEEKLLNLGRTKSP